jgi:hypothetical protein
MDHVAFLKPSWKLLHKILSGEKTVESRWYKTRRLPWDRVSVGDTIYFKEGTYVLAKAMVSKVEQYELAKGDVNRIASNYAARIGVEKEVLVRRNQDKRYCILIHLTAMQKMTPFRISKKGFGNMAAWICVPAVRQLIRK